MGQGQGSITVNQRKEAQTPPGPPFPLNSANSGLHVDAITGVIQLGSDPGGTTPLLQDTDVETANFHFGVIQGFGGRQGFQVDINNGIYYLGDNSGGNNGNKLFIDDVSRVSFLGDPTGTGNGTVAKIDDLNGQIKLGDPGAFQDGSVLQIDSLLGNSELQFFDNAGRYLILVPVTGTGGQYKIGDIDGIGNGMQMFIDDGNDVISIGDIIPIGNQAVLQIDDANSLVYGGLLGGLTGFTQTTITSTDGQFQVVGGGNRYLRINNNALIYAMGDIDTVDNGSGLFVDDLNPSLSFVSGIMQKQYLVIDVVNELYQLGDIQAAATGCFWQIQVGQFTAQNHNNRFLLIDTVNANCAFGDIDNVFSQTQFTMDFNVKTAGILLNGGFYLQLDQTNDLYSIGDINISSNGLSFQIDNAGEVFSLFAGAGHDKYLDFNIGAQTYNIGSITAGNGTSIQINDAGGNEFITLQGNNGIRTSPTILGNSDKFLWGGVVAGAVALDATRFVDVNIAGVAVKLLVAA